MQDKFRYSAVILDLDGTLYDSTEIDAMNIAAAIEAVAIENRITIEQASELFINSRKEVESSALLPVSKTLKKLGISPRQIELSQRSIINVKNLLKPDPHLSRLLENLKSRTKVALFTNTNSDLVQEILESLGVRLSVFDIVRAGSDLLVPKPSIEELSRLIRDLNAESQSCIMIGDRWEVDIEPAISLGIHHLHIANAEELKQWLREQLNDTL